MSNLVELPVTTYVFDEDDVVVDQYETEMSIDLSDIKSILKTKNGEVLAKDFSGESIEINTDYEGFKKYWSAFRMTRSFQRKKADE